MNVADDLEHRLGLSAQWTPRDEEYQRVAKYIKQRRFIRVIEELERLVVQRLFELSKANLMETGTDLIFYILLISYVRCVQDTKCESILAMQ